MNPYFRSSKLLCLVIVATLFAAPVAAQSVFNFGQFMTGRLGSNGRAELWVHNPVEVEMYVLAIAYEADGTLYTGFGATGSGCSGVALPTHGNDNEEFSAGSLDSSDELHFEMIAVPASTNNGMAGAIGPDYGVVMQKNRGEPTRAVDHRVFDVPNEDARLCLCCELLDDGEDDDLFDEFGLVCSDLTVEGDC